MFLRLTFFFLLCAGLLPAAPEPMVLEAKSPRSDPITGHLSITGLEAVCTLRGALARTTVTLTLEVDVPNMENPPRIEAGLSFSLPPNCVITGASLDIGSIMRRASLTFKETAGAAYRSVVSRELDPVLITISPDGMVKVLVFPITPGTPRVVQLEFSQVLTLSPAGLVWEFPLRLPSPVPQASLTTDAPGLKHHGLSLRPTFSGGAEWTLTALSPPADCLWPAQPDQAGIYTYQAILPPGPLPPAPRHLLVVVETSALQRDHDAASERRFLLELIARMGEGTITLAAYDTMPRASEEFQVKNGTCPGFFQSLASLTYDGAPRPGLLKLKEIPADLTVLIGSLQHPMDRYAWPELPKKAPVLVLDSVSQAPSTLALRLAGSSGGAVFNPRSPEPPVWFPRIPLADGHFTDPTFYLMPDQSAWFVTAKLTGVTLTAPEPGKPPLPVKANDTTAGDLTTLHRSRDRLSKHVQDAPGSLRHALPPEWASSPYLSERTGFIVLEEFDQYAQFKIPLPPDLAGEDAANNHTTAPAPRTDFECFSRALARAPGAVVGIDEWRRQLMGWKFEILAREWQKLIEFQEHRSPMLLDQRGLEEYVGKKLYRTSVENLEEATRQIPLLAALYPAAKTADRADFVRRSRAHQQAKVSMMEILNPEMWAGVFRSGGYTPSADPFSGPSRADTASMKQFFGSGAAADSAPGDPFSGEAPAFTQTNPATSSSLPPGPPALQAPEAASRPAEISSSARSLHREGRSEEALRTLSNLAAQPRPGHGALRFLAWQLIEWNERQTALEVLQQAHFLHGPTSITRRDQALVRSAFPHPNPDDSETLNSLPLGVARREAAALLGRDSADLRILLECADETADADLEIDGPDFETASWQNPLPAFGGALSFDGRGFTPEDFILVSAPTAPLTIRVRLYSKKPAPVRLTVFRNWGRPHMTEQVLLLPACAPGRNMILEVPAD